VCLSVEWCFTPLAVCVSHEHCALIVTQMCEAKVKGMVKQSDAATHTVCVCVVPFPEISDLFCTLRTHRRPLYLLYAVELGHSRCCAFCVSV
jgi:hypothetical protein